MSVKFNSRGTYAKIDLAKLRHNLNFIRSKLSQNAFLCPMVKADAYGHGDTVIARELEKNNISALGVVTIEEGIALRAAGVTASILVFGANDLRYTEEAVRNNLTLVVSNYDQLKVLKSFSPTKRIPIHIKFNTGMNRLGFDIQEAPKLADEVVHDFHVQGICTHFIFGEDADYDAGFSAAQMTSFAMVERVFQRMNPVVHYLNSAALLVRPSIPQDAPLSMGGGVGARPGISLYGVNPVSKPVEHDLKPIMSVHSRIEIVRKIKQNQFVSYGPLWKAQRDSIIGVVPIGYADGYPRGLTNCGHMIFRGKRVNVAGIVCMDYCMLDLTEVEGGEPHVGESVTVIGEEGSERVSVTEIAKKLNTIPYEILTKIGRRVTRVIEE